MRKKVVAGNWKMNMTPSETKKFLEEIIPKIDTKKADVIFCVPSIDIIVAKNELKGTGIFLGSQNIYYEEKGAFTGEISANMIKDACCQYVIVGHSERRQIFKETDEIINKKVLIALKNDIQPIICCGETLEQRENTDYLSFIKQQIIKALEGIDTNNIKKIIIAYEPIWAIGTGKTATSKDANAVCIHIRNVIKELYNEDIANEIRILYGGSVNEKNAKELFAETDIDGGLVGGSSLKKEFVDIINSV